MDKATALKMDRLIVNYLTDHGHFPPMKDRADRTVELEERLYRRLRRMQVGLESEMINQLKQRGYIGNTAEQRQLVEAIFQTPLEDMNQIVVNGALEGANLGVQLCVEDLQAQGMDILFNQLTDAMAEELRNKIYQFSQDTASRIIGDFQNTLANAVEEGLGIDEAARRLRNDFKNLRDYRLKNIARTEIQGAQNEGINRTIEGHNVRYKQWITVNDTRVRGNDPSDQADHVILHGEVVRVDEPFSNGLMHPLDRARGDIEDWINCRCRMRPYIPRRDEQILTTPYYPSAA